MRRLVVASVVVATTLLIVSSGASARTESNFTLLTNDFAQHQVGNSFRFREQLFSPADPSNQVGNDRVRCRQAGGNKLRCRGIVKLNGEFGGFGWLYVNGNIGPGDGRLNVTGGTGDFEGAAGKVISYSNANRLDFHLIY